VKHTLKFILILVFSLGLTACSLNEDTKQNNKIEENLDTEAVKMIANDEKIIEMLKKKGEIPEDATQEEITKALQKYLKDKSPGSLKDVKEKHNYMNELKEKIQKDKEN
jgi:bacillopeptidase F (M6 metalloprotease family)